MENKELRECPFCGNRPRGCLTYSFEKKQCRFVIQCTKCNAQMEYRNKESAINAWNRRANDGEKNN